MNLELTPTSLIVHVEPLDKLWSLKSRLEIPLAHVVGVARAEEEARGSYHEHAVAIQLKDEREATLAAVHAAIPR